MPSKSRLPLTTDWLDYFMRMAKLCASRSKDPSTQVGAVIVAPNRTVISTGYNGFPRGCRDDYFLYENREVKYQRTIHAEMNAILTAGCSLEDCSLFVWPLPPCDRCIPHIIQTGISHIIVPTIPNSSRWVGPCREAQKMASEANLVILTWDIDDE